MPERMMAERYFLVPLYFHENAAAAGVSAAQMKTVMTAATSGQQESIGYVMPWAGSVIGVSVEADTAVTANDLQVDPTIGGTATGLQAQLDTTNDTAHSATQGREIDSFAAGAEIGCELTTHASLAPETADLAVVVWCLLDLEGV